MRWRACYGILVFLFFFQAHAQEAVFQGQVLDAVSKEPIRAITVLFKDADHKILAFKTTDAQGKFELITKKDVSKAYLEVNHLGYKKKRITAILDFHNITIDLEIATILLEDVAVKSRPRIQQNGDTLSYDVSSFAKEEDRSIGDVLKRMPGVEVSESGQIKYQGKSISNFYIDGDDLLGNKYKIGTNTITHNMVKDVQVLNNHEHMKVMKNKRYSDEVALNLVIKDDAKLKLSNQAKIGAGLPHQYDGELNSMLFNKKYKGLNVLQGNNIGKELSSDIKGFSAGSILTKLGSSPINNLLSLGTVGNPPIGKPHYLFNDAVAIQANNLFNLPSKWQIVSNLQGAFDKSSRNFSGETRYFSEEANYSFDERQESKVRQWVGSISLKATKNEDHIYVENAFSLEYENDLSSAAISTNNSLYALSRRHHILGFKNALNYVPVLKNGNILQLSWLMNYGAKPQQLEIEPGVFMDYLNDGISYARSIQHVNVPSFYTNINAGYRLPKGIISQYYGLSATVDDQRLDSYISKHAAGLTTIVDVDSSKNEMHWIRSAISFEGGYEYKKNKFSTRLTLPVSYQRTAYSDTLYAVKEKDNKVRFNPSYSARYLLDQERELSFSYARKNSFGTIENVYRGLIIRNYRSLSNNSAGINESQSDDFALTFKGGKMLKMMFYNLGLSYKGTLSSALLSNSISDTISQSALIQRENSTYTYGIHAGFDKYLFHLASTLKVNASIEWTDYNQLFNDQLLPFQNIAYNLNPSLALKIWRKLNLSYMGTISLVQSKQVDVVGALDRDVVNISQSIGFPVTLFKGFHFNFSARHLYSYQEAFSAINYVFMDTFIRYRSKKWKTDFELNLTNLGNIKRFDTYTVSANMESHNSYQLRGRMGVLKMVFNM